MPISGNVFPRRMDKALPVAEKANELWIMDTEGNRYLDASGGPLVVNLGHGRKEIARALYKQVVDCDYAHPTMFTTPPVEELSKALTNHAPPEIDRFYFLTSGSEAVEAAIKLARQIHLECDRPNRVRLISRWKSYHGLTLGALAATGRTSFRLPFMPLLPEVIHIPPSYCFRCPYGLNYPACNIRCAHALEETILNLGPDTVSAFLAETVSGATLAGAVPPPEYFPIIREICDHYDVLLILDEVMCGLGRTGKWFACEHYNVVPDMVVNGKGLGAGAIALSSLGVRRRHFEAILNGSGGFVHGGTFSHHGVAAAAGVTVIRILEEEKLVERVAHYGKRLGNKLKESLEAHPHVGDIRGLGFLWGLEFVKNKKTSQPFPRREKYVERLWENIFRHGLILYRSTGMAGIDGDALLIGPPYTICEEHIDLIVRTLAEALEETDC